MAERGATGAAIEYEYEYEQFIKTIQHKAGISWEKAARAAAATLSTLAERLSQGKARDIAEQLPGNLGRWLADMKAELSKDFGPLLAWADASVDDLHPQEVVPVDEFLQRVADRAGLDRDDAGRASEAVLETLAERIAGGEVEDLARELPAELPRRWRAGTPRATARRCGSRWTSS